jgi:hypothetical protein
VPTSDNDRGYHIVPGVFDTKEAAQLLSALEDAGLVRSRAGARHLMGHSMVRDLARDPRLMAIAVRALGTAAIPYRATLFDKSPARNWLVPWHQDTALPLEQRRDVPGWGPWSEKAGEALSDRPRRVLHIEYIDSLDVGDGLHVAIA